MAMPEYLTLKKKAPLKKGPSNILDSNYIRMQM